MANPSPTTPGTAPGDSTQPQPGQAGSLARKLAAKAGANVAAAKPPPLLNKAGTKGGRGTVAEESAAFLAKSGLVAVPANSANDSGLAPVQPVYVVTPEFVGEVTEKVLKGIESWDVAHATHQARVLVGDAKLAKEYGDSFAAPPGCIDTIAKSMMEISRKYPNILQWAPEFAALGAAGAWILKRNEGHNALAACRVRLNKQLEAASAPARSVSTPPPIPSANDNAKP